MKFLLSISLAGLLSFSAFSQQKQWVDSKEYITEGMKYIVEKDYERAIDEFHQVSANDTNYVLAQLEEVYCYSKLDKDSVVIGKCRMMIPMETKFDHLFREYLIESMHHIKDSDVFEEIAMAKSKYPFNEDFILMEAIANKKFENYDQSIKVLQDLIKRNPFNKNAHFHLGSLMADKGDFIRATISLECFLMLSSSSNVKTASAITILSDMFKNKHEITITNVKKDELFKEVEELIESGLALKKAYKTDAPLDDPIVRQTDVLVKNLEYKKGTADFWMEFYVPFLNKVKSQGMLRGYTYQFLSFIDADFIQAGVKKYRPEVDRFIKFAAEYFDDLQSKSTLVVQGKSVTEKKGYDDGKLLTLGKKEGDKYVGTWYVFHRAGSLQAVVNYNNNGKKNDSVYEYHMNGKLKYHYYFKNGVLEGKYLEYFSNGELKSELYYKGDSLDGLQKTFYANGSPKETIEYKKGKRNGKMEEFDNNGNRVSELNYKNGKYDGLQKLYHIGNVLKREIYYKDGMVEGSSTSYYTNGKVSSKGSFAKGNPVGKWEEFFENGKPKRLYYLNAEGNYIDSALNYHHNGQLESVMLYNKKSQPHGLYRAYSAEGKLFNTLFYKKGAIKKWEYFSADGKLINSGGANLVNYNEYGNMDSKGALKKDYRTGRWEFYYPNGDISAIGTYDEYGQLSGTYEEYYHNGTVKSKTTYENGEFNGPYSYYYENGKLQTEGWYINGEHAGEWTWYYLNGNVEQKTYYINDEASGTVENWNADSTMEYSRRYKDQLFEALWLYGPDDKPFQKLETKNGNGVFTYPAEGGAMEYKTTYRYGVLHGRQTKKLKSGVVISDENYEGGHHHGKHVYRYPNGQPSLESDYMYGDYHGAWYYYAADGTMTLQRHYSYGNSCDSTVWYYPSGAPKIKEFYNDMGQVSGIVTWYFENGKVKRLSQHAYGERDGWTYDYDPEGRLMYKRWYENGNVVLLKGLAANGKDTLTFDVYGKSDSVVVYYDNGKRAHSCYYNHGLLHGTWKKYFYDGSVMEQDEYFYDESNGESIDYYISGKIYQIEHNSYGESHGEQLYYYENGQLFEQENQYLGILHGTNKSYNKKGVPLVNAEYRQGVLIKNNMK
ncbi:MAG: hypothetical protein ACKOXB_11560 [Flavobacteriales bacterium]